MSAIGIMDGAFFVGRKEVVDWINSTLEINISKIEDTAAGHIACQLLDIMHPGQVPMHKVNWSAKQNFELVANYKILQTAFSKLHIDKFVDVDRLISGRYMDNLEFMQWFKRFYEMNVADKGDYDCVGQRSKGKGGSTFQFSSGAAKSTKPASAGSTRPAPAKTSPAKPVSSLPAKPATAPSVPSSTTTNKSTSRQNAAASVQNVNNATSSTADTSKPAKATAAPSTKGLAAIKQPIVESGRNYEAELAALAQANEEQTKQYAELKLEVDGLEKERDFYFDKLRDIEILLQDVEEQGQGNAYTAAIFKILYATAEGFQPIDDKVASGIDGNEAPIDETF